RKELARFAPNDPALKDVGKSIVPYPEGWLGNAQLLRDRVRVALSSNGNRMAAQFSGRLVVWDVESRQEKLNLILSDSAVPGTLGLDPNGNWIVWGDDRRIRIRNLVDGSEQEFANDGRVKRVCLSSDGRVLAAVFDDVSIKVWDLDKRREL